MRWKSFQTRVSVGINENTVSCSGIDFVIVYCIANTMCTGSNNDFFADYSVLVENVPGNATKADEWIEFFKNLSPLDEQGGKIADITIALNNGD